MISKPGRQNSYAYKRLLWRIGLVAASLGCCFIPTVGIMRQALTAERIYASYSVVERSISVAALEKYAREGILDEELAVYAQYISPQQLEQLRRVLLTQIDLTPVAVAQFLYTPQGIILLKRLGQIVQTEARQPGFYAIRSALILAAATPEGLTPLNVLRQFPTRSIRIDLARSLRIAEQLERLVNQTGQAIALVQQDAVNAANTQPPIDFGVPDLRERGPFSWNQQTLTLFDPRRDRQFLADIYLPLNLEKPAPVIVISHGLGSDRTSFIYLATQLASYGFAVAVPEHPGSNAEQLRSLLSGVAAEVAQPNEFINRPLDVRYLLNELERLRISDPRFRNINIQQVGVIGQSFGGYTALALAGAQLNFKQLQQDCNTLQDSTLWNVSLLLQCRALELPATDYALRDPRIKAAIAVNPITSSVFGEASIRQIAVPVMIVSGSADTIAPTLAEQIRPFSWLTTPDKYLAVIVGATHFSTIGEAAPGSEPITVPPQVIGPTPEVARSYISALSVPFFQTYINNSPQYRSYLSSAYTQAVSETSLPLSLVRSSSNELEQFLR
ncbi:alpha/beta hydrolase [Gloeocapsopsis crepidinum]|uniref:alpha/beta hydrolase n=1 Tax=Gloeocapsopsis crepidinum TaxID=693223 RepID=UPI001D1459B5|nr:alpha/beta hydrolase [Gloeocapsopsis crepidinum]